MKMIAAPSPRFFTALPIALAALLFMAADWVVKAMMIGLAFASLITWTV